MRNRNKVDVNMEPSEREVILDIIRTLIDNNDEVDTEDLWRLYDFAFRVFEDRKQNNDRDHTV